MNSLEMTGYLAAEQASMRPNFSGSAQQIYFNYKQREFPYLLRKQLLKL